MLGDNNMTTLKLALENWEDVDVAIGSLAECLGLRVSGSDHSTAFYWTKTPLSSVLCYILNSLVQVGVLEQNDDGEYRWNQAFPPSLDQYYESDWSTPERKSGQD